MLKQSNTKNRHIRVVSPSRSLEIVNSKQVDFAERRLKEMGFTVSYGKNLYNGDIFSQVPLNQRLEDINNAIDDPTVDIIMSSIGGYSTGELLEHLDYKAIRINKKIFVGMSDVSVLLNSIFLRSGLVCILGPHFSSFGSYIRQPYTEKMFLNALDYTKDVILKECQFYGNENWYKDQENWMMKKNEGSIVIREGCARGIAIGGNVSSIVGRIDKANFTALEPVILFLEIHKGYHFLDYVKWIFTILSDIGEANIAGVCFGKWSLNEDTVNPIELDYFQTKIKQVLSCPIVMNLDFGHNIPLFSVRIGGKTQLTIKDFKCTISLLAE